MNFSVWEIGLILLIVVVLFGARRLPELGKGLGSGIKNFKSALRDGEQKEIADGRDGEPARDPAKEPATYR